MKFSYILSILFFLSCSSVVFANSEVLQKLNNENKKIQLEIEKIWEEKISLKNQTNFLEKRLEQLFVEKKIFLEKKQQFQTKLEEKIWKKTDIEIFSEISENEISKFILKLHREEKKAFSNWKENFIKLFFLETWIQKFFEDLKNFKKIEKINEKIFQNYELIWEKNSEEIEKFSQLKKEISQLDNKIIENWKELLEIKKAKETLFNHYSQQEDLFKEKLEENKKTMLLSLLETQKILLEQQKIDKKISTWYKKIQETKKTTWENIFEKSETLEWKSDPYDIDWFSNLDDKKFIWPIDKNRWITANFLDEEYEKKFWIKHYAIDIRAKQWTKIRATANAFVYKIEKWWNDWMWYSYIILAHKWSIQTVYWHISKSLVKEWDIVLKWQIFALTWWMPGTPWAWNLTTWPHLHLEFHENWKPVNPLNFLD